MYYKYTVLIYYLPTNNKNYLPTIFIQLIMYLYIHYKCVRVYKKNIHKSMWIGITNFLLTFLLLKPRDLFYKYYLSTRWLRTICVVMVSRANCAIPVCIYVVTRFSK